MTIRFGLVRAFAVAISMACAGIPARLPAQQEIDPGVAELGAGFVSSTADVNGTTLHYVHGGTGPAIILLHGFPQDWYEFHQIMPRLAQSFTVIAVDLRGIGGSKGTPGGYDAQNLAEDVHQLAQQLKLERVYVVGHDLGGIVAYAFARLHPEETRGVMILDVPLPGIEPWEDVKADPLLWHINFHQTPDLPEQLIAGRQGSISVISGGWAPSTAMPSAMPMRRAMQALTLLPNSCARGSKCIAPCPPTRSSMRLSGAR